MYDSIIIGAGLTGITLANLLAFKAGKRVLLVDKRNHIGGNVFDCYDHNGILTHPYGPHIFHTDNKEVWHFLSKYTEWTNYNHHVLAVIDGKDVPLPFNFNTIYALFPLERARRFEELLLDRFSYNAKIPILKLKATDDKELAFLANYIYEKVFYNYTRKQWGLNPEDMDAEVTGRVPVYLSRDDRYFQDYYQGLPRPGYTEMCKKMLDHKNISVLLQTDMKDLVDVDLDSGRISYEGHAYPGKLIYTGMIDEFFNYMFGRLPYRTLDFAVEYYNREWTQKAGTVNYPNENDYTRITEYKHLTGQKHHGTTIAREYPREFESGKGDIPYYPYFTEGPKAVYEKYRILAKKFENIIFAGRLAEYRYYDMDDAVASALGKFEELYK